VTKLFRSAARYYGVYVVVAAIRYLCILLCMAEYRTTGPRLSGFSFDFDKLDPLCYVKMQKAPGTSVPRAVDPASLTTRW
jgi:hypothetical protein